jgi:hypothetical protein
MGWNMGGGERGCSRLAASPARTRLDPPAQPRPSTHVTMDPTRLPALAQHRTLRPCHAAAGARGAR